MAASMGSHLEADAATPFLYLPAAGQRAGWREDAVRGERVLGGGREGRERGEGGEDRNIEGEGREGTKTSGGGGGDGGSSMEAVRRGGKKVGRSTVRGVEKIVSVT